MIIGREGVDIIIGIDAGTSVIKAVAFDLSGRQLGVASVLNRYRHGPGGAAVQSLDDTWADCARAIRELVERHDGFADRVAAVSVTGQGDGTWLVGRDGRPFTDAWLWLDARAAPTVARLQSGPLERARFEATGTGLNTCQQGAQLAHMAQSCPELLAEAGCALHCKDWLFLQLTGVRATDPSEASFTFGNFRSRAYDDTVIEALGLSGHRHLLPPILDGTRETMPLTAEAAAATGLRAGTPVSLGFVDMVMTALGAGVHTGAADVACSTVGSTGVHMRAVRDHEVALNDENTGYVILLPAPHMVTQVQTNMAATLNIDWALRLAGDLIQEFGPAVSHGELVARIDGWMARSAPGALLYHPYISDTGERGPFIDAQARASFLGLSAGHRFPDLLRGVVEGLGMATRDCYAAMGPMPSELRLTGGAARSRALRAVLSACVGAPVRVCAREEAGAAGAAMMASVAIGAYDSMDACIAEWVTPLLDAPEEPDAGLAQLYARNFEGYRLARRQLAPVWHEMAASRQQADMEPAAGSKHTEQTMAAADAAQESA